MDFTVSVCMFVNHAQDIWACASRELPNLRLQFDFLSLISGSELSDMSLEESDVLIEEQ